jgi:hypothetical protein
VAPTERFSNLPEGKRLPVSDPPQRWWLVFPVCLGLFLLALALPLIQGKIYVENDLGMYHLPTRWYYARCLERGENFMWWNQAANGVFLHGEGQAGLLHPVHWLLYRTLPFETAFNLELLIPYVLCLAGCFLFARRHLSPPSAWIHAWMVTGSSFFLLHFCHTNMVGVMAHLPWMLWLVERLYEGPGEKAQCWPWVGLAMALASQLLLGHPPAVVVSSVILGLWVLTAMPFWKQKGRTGLLVLALLAGSLLGAVQVLPTLAEAGRSIRQDWSMEQRVSGSLHPLNLVQWFAPYFFDGRVYQAAPSADWRTIEGGFYPGSVTLVLAALGVMAGLRAADSRRRFVLAWLTAGLLCLVLTLGSYGGLYLLLASVPPFDHMRSPSRFMSGVLFAMGSLAAVGFERLLEHDHAGAVPRAERNAIAALVILAWTPGLWMALAAAPFRGQALLGGVLISLAALLAFAALRKSKWAPAVLVILAVIDQGYYGMSMLGKIGRAHV